MERGAAWDWLAHPLSWRQPKNQLTSKHTRDWGMCEDFLSIQTLLLLSIIQKKAAQLHIIRLFPNSERASGEHESPPDICLSPRWLINQ